ncbi:MAG: hypothetical protein WCA46_21970 [Actinocatenispora sp.]
MGQLLTRRASARSLGLRGALAALAAAGVVAGLSLTSTPTNADDATATTHVTGRTSVVALPTGDRIALTTDAHGHIRYARPAGPSHESFLTQHLGADTYVIPARAVHRLGHDLSLSQFDVSAKLAGRPAAKPGTVHPNFPMRTVTLPVVDGQGAPPQDSFLSVVNVDDTRMFVGFPQVVDGETRISVPDGHYAVMAYSVEFGSGDSPISEHIAFDTFTVDGKAVTHTVDLGTATHRLGFTTPKQATLGEVELDWYRGSSADVALGSGIGTWGDHPIYLSSSPAGHGVQHFAAYGRLASAADVAKPYTYDLTFHSDGTVGANQQYRATADSLATVDTRYYADKARTGDSVWFGTLPWESIQFRSITPFAEPVHRTEYLTGDPDILYQAGVDALSTDEAWGGTEYGGYRIFQPGQKLSQDWMRGPIVPGIPADTGAGDYYCQACREGDTLSVALSPVTDSGADHSGYLDASDKDTTSTAHFVLYQGDKKIADEKDVTGGDFTVPADSAKYRLVYDQTRIAPWTAQSTKTHTELTFASEHSGATTVPGHWLCGIESEHAKNCSPVGLMTANYQLTQGLDGTVAPGPDSLVLTVNHAPGAGHVPVEAATVSVSYDDGATWTPTKVSDLGSGKFRANWTNPASAAGGPVALKITAKDATGATISQLVHDALTVKAGS